MITVDTPQVQSVCPKSMVYGPCGGVAFDGSCEIDAQRQCVFLDFPTVAWAEPGEMVLAPTGRAATHLGKRTSAAQRTLARMGTEPLIIGDFAAPALDVDALHRHAETLVGSVDVVLAGDAGNTRVQFSPAFRASLIQSHGLPVWSGVNCRDRNRVALEGEIAALAEVGVFGVHCVTGDHTATGLRPDAMPVFDLDSTRLVPLARSYGHVVSVGEAPLCPPIDRRPERLAEKQRAGAELCFIDHAGSVSAVSRFIEQAGELGVQLPYIVCVPVVLDPGTVQMLEDFPGMVLPEGLTQRVLEANDPREEGMRAAVELCEQMLAIPGVIGVDLSGGPTPGAELEYARSVAEIGRRLMAQTRASRVG